MKYVILILVSVLSIGCATTHNYIDSRGLNGRILIDPVMRKRYLVKTIDDSSAVYLHEMLPGNNGAIYYED